MIHSQYPNISYLTIYLLTTVGYWSSNSKCVTHWRFERGDVIAVIGEEEDILNNDPLFRILINHKPSSTKVMDNVSGDVIAVKSQPNLASHQLKSNSSTLLAAYGPAVKKFEYAVLTCGEPVNETAIDHLEGIVDRLKHPPYPEPDVALLFRKNEFDNVQLDVIEINLLDALQAGENKLVLYNQIGNFLRIRGDTYHAMECFRSALTISHNNPDVLLNLARMLLNLNYMRDAIYLAERSLDHEHPEQSTWLQHFTLAEILEKTGEFERALNHLQLALNENPSFHPAHIIYQRLEKNPIHVGSNIHTLIVISLLCSCILLYIYITVIKEPQDGNNNISNTNNNSKSYKRLLKRTRSIT